MNIIISDLESVLYSLLFEAKPIAQMDDFLYRLSENTLDLTALISTPERHTVSAQYSTVIAHVIDNQKYYLRETDSKYQYTKQYDKTSAPFNKSDRLLVLYVQHRDKVEAVKQLIRVGADGLLMNQYGHTALSHAIEHNNTEAAREIISSEPLERVRQTMSLMGSLTKRIIAFKMCEDYCVEREREILRQSIEGAARGQTFKI